MASEKMQTYPQLYSVMTSLKSCLNALFPDHLKNDKDGFEKHLSSKRQSLQTERNQWKYGLNYVHETLRKHIAWHKENRQYVQLLTDEKRLEHQVEGIQAILKSFTQKVEMESELRVAKRQKRGEIFEFMFSLRQTVDENRQGQAIVVEQCSPLEIHISIKDGFELWIVLEEESKGTIQSATLKVNGAPGMEDQDNDLKQSLQLYQKGEQQDKFKRLIKRVHLKIKHANVNLAETEQVALDHILAIGKRSKFWHAERSVEGIAVSFLDLKHSATKNTNADISWKGTLHFSEWKGVLCYEVIGSENIYCCSALAKNIATLLCGGGDGREAQDGEKGMIELARWNADAFYLSTRGAQAANAVHSFEVNDVDLQIKFIKPPQNIPGAIELHSFPILTKIAINEDKLAILFSTIGQALIVNSLYQSCFADYSPGDTAPLDGYQMASESIQIMVDLAHHPNLKIKFNYRRSEIELVIMVATNYTVSASLMVNGSMCPNLTKKAASLVGELRHIPKIIHEILKDFSEDDNDKSPVNGECVQLKTPDAGPFDNLIASNEEALNNKNEDSRVTMTTDKDLKLLGESMEMDMAQHEENSVLDDMNFSGPDFSPGSDMNTLELPQEGIEGLEMKDI